MDWATKPEPVGGTRWRFPSPAEMPESDLVTVGGDLEPSTLIHAYRQRHFPDGGHRHAGRDRLVVARPARHRAARRAPCHRSMRQSARRFDDPDRHELRPCDPRLRRSVTRGWLDNPRLHRRVHERLHGLGWAHSVEVFDREGELAGGLYGVRVGGMFAGESMFHHKRDASKVALMALVDLMRESGMTLLDVQWCTDHLASLGAVAIPRADYLARLETARDST